MWLITHKKKLSNNANCKNYKKLILIYFGTVTFKSRKNIWILNTMFYILNNES